MTLSEYISKSLHLPRELRDFHDQKYVFKSLFDWATRDGERSLPPELKDLSWVSAHIYTIDFFLRFMAMHGYTLQRSRVKLTFAGLDATIADRREREAESFRRVMEERKS